MCLCVVTLSPSSLSSSCAELEGDGVADLLPGGEGELWVAEFPLSPSWDWLMVDNWFCWLMPDWLLGPSAASIGCWLLVNRESEFTICCICVNKTSDYGSEKSGWLPFIAFMFKIFQSAVSSLSFSLLYIIVESLLQKGKTHYVMHYSLGCKIQSVLVDLDKNKNKKKWSILDLGLCVWTFYPSFDQVLSLLYSSPGLTDNEISQ